MTPGLGPDTLPCNIRMYPEQEGRAIVPDLQGPVGVLNSDNEVRLHACPAPDACVHVDCRPHAHMSCPERPPPPPHTHAHTLSLHAQTAQVSTYLSSANSCAIFLPTHPLTHSCAIHPPTQAPTHSSLCYFRTQPTHSLTLVQVISVVNVSVLLAAEQHKHPHDAIFLPNGDMVVATWAPGRVSYWKLLPTEDDVTQQ
jgi:hypothetical protein